MPDASSPRPVEALRSANRERFWRGIDELLDTSEFRDAIRREFPVGAAELSDGVSRRSFVKLLGASVALAGLGGCVRRAEDILPYVAQPPELTPGLPLYFATSMVLDGYATGLLVESHVGRPTKVEGNPQHPASLGAAGVYEQASVLQLYDPQRARHLRRAAAPATWSDFVRNFALGQAQAPVGPGSGAHFLLEPTSSPLLTHLLARLRRAYPEARVHFYSPLSAAESLASARAMHGRPLQPQFDFRRAEVVLSLDSDFLASGPFHLRYAHDFADRRRITGPADSMNRLYVAEARPTPTGTMADHRLRVRAGDVPHVAAAVLSEVMLSSGGGPPSGVPEGICAALERFRALPLHEPWVRAVARDLRASAGRGIVLAGDRQPAVVHALAHALNASLGNVERTMWYGESPILDAGQPSHELAELASAIRAGSVTTLIILDGNPSYTAPADLELSRLIRSVPTTVYLGLYENETAGDCSWFIPAAHYLESWGDARAYDGTVSFIQPLIEPLYSGRTPAEVLAVLLGDPDPSPRTMLRDFWRVSREWPDFESEWSGALQLGFLRGSQSPPASAGGIWPVLASGLAALSQSSMGEAIEVSFVRDSRVYDGRFANNAWLQELPDPITKLTWDNAALLSPTTAERLGAETGQMLEIVAGVGALRIPALVAPGHAEDAVSLSLGYGRQGSEVVASGVGFDAYRLRSTRTPYVARDVTVRPVVDAPRHRFATTQLHWSMQGRPIVLAASLDEYRSDPGFTARYKGPTPTLHSSVGPGAGSQWAMAIDLSLCTGCSACVVACQAENNVPVVGREGVLESREMHWLRIDRYFTGPADDPRAVAQPMLCQHCDQAPCEYVCPVNATVQSHDGLNEMVYNRCVGTRFCSNNCPYKVRRYNWFDYSAELAVSEAMVKNPDVTVRERGVMEKCTFCVQRIRQTEIAARVEGRPRLASEVRTACEQACPTRAITFGSYTDPDDELLRRMAEERSYEVLHELGTRPRIRYLARIDNPDPALRAAGA